VTARAGNGAGEPPRVAFILAPSIDVLGGRVVRLRNGDPAQASVYGRDPAAMARRWAREGADVLHVVDLDGALSGSPAQAAVTAEVVRAGLESGIPSEVAGGLRDEASVARALATGAERAVLGTALLVDPTLAARLVARHGSARVVAALDVREGRVVGEGWRPGATSEPLDRTIARLVDAGITTLEVTSISRDGTMAGPDLDLLARVRRLAPASRLLASGGVRSARDVALVRDAGCAGVILGRALYEGAFTLAGARSALAGRRPTRVPAG
jgi:phosphoribosylformimino-5-aminoimidazole carboxamide ribotide isomerase